MVRDPARFWLPLVLVYFALHAALRAVLGQPLTDAEALITEVGWALDWTYPQMMPLYPWLQHGMFALLGPGVLAVAALKNAILVVLTVAIYLLVRSVAGRGWAWLSVLSLMLLPQVSWYAQHGLGDDLLAATLAAVSVLLLRLLRVRPGTARYLGLGLCLGLGALSAVSFVWFLAALLIAGLSLAPYRNVLVRPQALVAALVAAALAAVPLVMGGGEIGFGLTQGAGMEAAVEAARYLQALIGSAALLFGVVVLALVTGYDRASEVAEDLRELRQLLARIAATGMVVLLASTMLGLAQDIGRAQILPVALFLAPAVALFICPLITNRGRLKISRLAGGVALAVLAASPIYHSWKMGQDQRVEITARADPAG